MGEVEKLFGSKTILLDFKYFVNVDQVSLQQILFIFTGE